MSRTTPWRLWRERCRGAAGTLILCPNGSFFSGLVGLAAGKVEIRPVYLQRPGPLSGCSDPRWTAAQSVRDRGFEIDGKFHVPQGGAYHCYHAERCVKTCLSKGVPDEKISVIPNFVDTDFIRPLPKDNDLLGRMVCLTNLSSPMREVSATSTTWIRCSMRPHCFPRRRIFCF